MKGEKRNQKKKEKPKREMEPKGVRGVSSPKKKHSHLCSEGSVLP